MSLRQKVEDRFIPEPNSGCWLWIGAVNQSGYGTISHNGRNRAAHRAVYELYRGPIPDGKVLDHLCRVPSCVNPDHLEPVTQRINVLRGTGVTSRNAKKTHCKRGHLLGGANTRRLKGFSPHWRECKTCHREWLRQYKRRKRRNDAGLRQPTSEDKPDA